MMEAYLPKVGLFQLTLPGGRAVHIGMADGAIFTKEPLAPAGKYYEDEETSFYSCEASVFFQQVGPVTITFLRLIDLY